MQRQRHKISVLRIEPNTRHFYLTDFHSPYYDKRAMALVLRVMAGQKWASVILGGDIHDYYQLSRYDKDPSRLLDLQDELDVTISLLRKIRKAARNADIFFIPGNHEGRLDKHLRRNAPALVNLRTNSISEQLQLKQLGIRLLPHRQHYFLTPTFRVCHGAGNKDDGCEYSKHSAWSAKKNLEKFWGPGISGHTHRLGAFFATHAGQPFYWYEGGCLCDIPRVSADYAAQANWQLGFAILTTVGKDVHVRLVPIVKYRCTFGGKLFVG